jgi:hypothetical protein
MKEKSSSPLLTVLTRCNNRPAALKRNQDSLLSQTKPDFEQLQIRDGKNRGRLWANTAIHENAHLAKGKYIYVLDDDDYIICDTFIEDLTVLIANIDIAETGFHPSVVIVKGYINEKIFPTTWKQKPERGEIGAPNFLVKNNIFCKFSQHWCQPRAGDFYFIDAIFKSKARIFWWNKLIFNTTADEE